MILFLAFSFLNSLILPIFLNELSIARSIVIIIKIGLLCICPMLFLYIYIVGKYIAVKKFFKTFIIIFLLILLVGLIAFLGQYFNISFINKFFDIVANSRLLAFEKGLKGFEQETLSNYIAFGLPRLDNLHEEPSFYARFLFVFLPLIYNISTVKQKLLKSGLLDRILKRTIYILAWLNLFLTFSPIFILLSCCITIFHFKSFIKKYWYIVLTIFSIFIIGLSLINLQETFLSRILIFITRIRSFSDFIAMEPSLAGRIIIYINLICIFFKNILFGVGFGQAFFLIINQLASSPIDLTPGVQTKLLAALTTGSSLSYNTGFIYTVFCENGIFISILFMIFCKSLYVEINKIIKNSSYELIIKLAKGLKWSLISLFILMFYDMTSIQIEMYMIFSMCLILIYYQKKQIRKVKYEISQKNAEIIHTNK